MKKLTSLLLALILVFFLLPTAVYADSPSEGSRKPNWSHKGDGKGGKGDKDKGDRGDKSHKHRGKAAEAAHDHEYGSYGSNPTYHWLECACGCRINVEPHVDPLDTEDDYCFCGYHFSDNAELVTLWLQDCKSLKNFRRDVYEYETDAYTYKEVNEIKRIATRTYDSEATVEIPEDLTLKEGENKIEIKVTSENKKVTKIYTVIVNKEAKK